ncbi:MULTISPECIES: hypothetical protein [unclassified Nostoc]|nr:hypothetical protein [Nostoc sp. JL34]
MSQFPSVTGREVIAALSKVSFEVARLSASHHYDDFEGQIIIYK